MGVMPLRRQYALALGLAHSGTRGYGACGVLVQFGALHKLPGRG